MKNHSQRLVLFFLMVTCINQTIKSQVPSDLMDNCNQWKITYPTGDEDKTLCDEANNEYFYVNDTGDAIVFRAPIRSDNGTTPNSSNIRSELREREEDGSADIYWTTEGRHMVYVKQAISHLPINKPHLVATQIHGNKEDGIDDSMVMRLENSHLFLSFNGGKLRDNITIKSDYSLGDIHEVIFLVVDGKHYCYYSEDGHLLNAFNTGSAASYLVKDGSNDYVMDLSYDQSYFKIGNYTQSNADEEGDDTDNIENYGEVLVYDFSVAHGDLKVSEVILSPVSINLLQGYSQQLLATVIPSTATNTAVSYSSSDSAIAKVDSNGLVTALVVGSTIITVTTNDGSYTDTCVINVVEESEGVNHVLNKSITGTGIHDADNEVANLIDGLTTTRWSVSGFPQTATIDLGAVFKLERTEMVCYDDRDYQYTITVSNTEFGDYTELVDRSDNMTAGAVLNPIIDIFSAVEARYIKITITGAGTYTGSWMSLLEFRVFGEDLLSIENLSSTEQVLLWPNPATTTIHLSSYKDFNKLSVYDTLGKLIFSQVIHEESIDISNLKPGIYHFKFSGVYKTIAKRVIIK